MQKVWDVVNQISPVILGALITFCVWMTSELYACKYTMLTEEDGRRIKAEAVETSASKLDLILSEVSILRTKVDEMSNTQAEMLAEIRHLKENH